VTLVDLQFRVSSTMTAMLSLLPDELLHEILSSLFHVPDDKFASTEGESPFASVSESSCMLLPVCKRWLRIAYPLLYLTVVIRSSAQAQALSDSLRANKTLGRYIRKLRLEGGYGAVMQKIITLAPNITDLYLTLVIWSDDSASGICRSLAAINPSRIILHDDLSGGKFNVKARQLVNKLCEFIPLWSNLVNRCTAIWSLLSLNVIIPRSRSIFHMTALVYSRSRSVVAPSLAL
jgi:hypothetical protein